MQQKIINLSLRLRKILVGAILSIIYAFISNPFLINKLILFLKLTSISFHVFFKLLDFYFGYPISTCFLDQLLLVFTKSDDVILKVSSVSIPDARDTFVGGTMETGASSGLQERDLISTLDLPIPERAEQSGLSEIEARALELELTNRYSLTLLIHERIEQLYNNECVRPTIFGSETPEFIKEQNQREEVKKLLEVLYPKLIHALNRELYPFSNEGRIAILNLFIYPDGEGKLELSKLLKRLQHLVKKEKFENSQLFYYAKRELWKILLRKENSDL